MFMIFKNWKQWQNTSKICISLFINFSLFSVYFLLWVFIDFTKISCKNLYLYLMIEVSMGKKNCYKKKSKSKIMKRIRTHPHPQVMLNIY